jgi:GT2 family glycosyltransferase
MIPGPLLRIGKLMPKSVRSAAYVAWTGVEGFVHRRPVLIGDESGGVATRERLWTGRPQVLDGSLRPWSISLGSSEDAPEIDVSVVTFNSAEVIGSLVDSILRSSYPPQKIRLRVTDNSSTDNTIEYLESRRSEIEHQLAVFDLQVAPNDGFGAGHNRGIRRGSASLVLVINPDLQLQADCLSQLVARSLRCSSEWVAFEPRQFPYEHPKVYDPITHEVSWNSHACVLIRREAFEAVEGYDESIFLYGEDVEMSYRLRNAGYRLAYVPAARTEHDALDSPTRNSTLQFRGGVSSNIRIRMQYGDHFARAAAGVKLLRLIGRGELRSHRGFLAGELRRIPRLRRENPVNSLLEIGYPINGWGFDLRRDGDDVHLGSAFDAAPTDLVSIITRSILRHEVDLLETMATVANQTYRNLEHVIVLDGITAVPESVQRFADSLPHPVKFVTLPKVGRSAAGNIGVTSSSGSLLMFLDDDDLLFADHVEVLTQALRTVPRAAAAYSRAFEVTVNRIGARLGPEKTVEVPELHRQSFDFDVLLHHNYMAIQSVLFRRFIVDERGGLREDLDLLEDWNLWIRFAYKQHFIEVPKVTSLYRVSATSQLNERRRRALADAYVKVRAENQLDLHALDRQFASRPG